jgi:hypothetical protein
MFSPIKTTLKMTFALKSENLNFNLFPS